MQDHSAHSNQSPAPRQDPRFDDLGLATTEALFAVARYMPPGGLCSLRSFLAGSAGRSGRAASFWGCGAASFWGSGGAVVGWLTGAGWLTGRSVFLPVSLERAESPLAAGGRSAREGCAAPRAATAGPENALGFCVAVTGGF